MLSLASYAYTWLKRADNEKEKEIEGMIGMTSFSDIAEMLGCMHICGRCAQGLKKEKM